MLSPISQPTDVLELTRSRGHLNIGAGRWKTHAEAKMAVFDSIECFYNARRRHSAINYLSPAEFERRALRPTIAA